VTEHGSRETGRGPGTVRARIGREAYRTELAAGDHEWIADEPVEAGGEGWGPNPYDLLLAALGACKAITLRMYADRKGWPLRAATIELSHGRIHAEDCADCESGKGTVDEIRVELALEGDLSDEQRRRLAEIAERCPVHRTLTSETKIRTRLRPEEGTGPSG
jgi:putative redox protein